MKESRSNLWFWASTGIGALALTIQSVLLYGPIGVPLGIGSGASLGIVVFYLGSMLISACRWISQQMRRSP